MDKENKFSRIITGVMGIIQNSRGEVLFIKQRKGPYANNWLLPGGSIEYGETCIQAVKREVYEETSIKISNPQFTSIYEMLGEWRKGRYHLLMFGFKDYSDDQIISGFKGDNVDDIRWLDPYDIELHSTDKKILTDAGFARFTTQEIESALKVDGILMHSYTGSLT